MNRFDYPPSCDFERFRRAIQPHTGAKWDKVAQLVSGLPNYFDWEDLDVHAPGEMR
jgi:hypothetical protein